MHESDYCLYLGDCTFCCQLNAFKGRMGAFSTIGESSCENKENYFKWGAALIAHPIVGILHTFAMKDFSRLQL